MVTLVPILRTTFRSLPHAAAQIVTEVCDAYDRLYASNGFNPPWIGYFALENETIVGTCGFKSAPVKGRVEIAYFSFPGNEGRGIATAMAQELIEITRKQSTEIAVTAQTLREENASTSILKKLGFQWIGTIDSPEDGPVWEWELPAS